MSAAPIIVSLPISDRARSRSFYACGCREPGSVSRDQAIFVDRATGAGLSSYEVLLKIDQFG